MFEALAARLPGALIFFLLTEGMTSSLCAGKGGAVVQDGVGRDAHFARRPMILPI